jgi:tyrosine-protein kinase Etk/Wzc
MQQFEEAKIAEARDTPTVQVLDHAQPPERKSAPKRSRIVILSVMLGTIAGVSLAFFRERIALVEDNPREARQWADLGRKLNSSFEGLNRSLRRRRQ